MNTTAPGRSYMTNFGVEMRRIYWPQLWRLRPDRRSANDNSRSAARRVEPAVPTTVFAEAVAQVSDQKAAQRADSSANKSAFAAFYDSADESASSCANTNIALGRSATGERRNKKEKDSNPIHLWLLPSSAT